MEMEIEDKVIYRWYAFVGGKWRALNWQGDTEEQAIKKAKHEFFKNEFDNKKTKLVCERTSFVAIDESESANKE